MLCDRVRPGALVRSFAPFYLCVIGNRITLFDIYFRNMVRLIWYGFVKALLLLRYVLVSKWASEQTRDYVQRQKGI